MKVDVLSDLGAWVEETFDVLWTYSIEGPKTSQIKKYKSVLYLPFIQWKSVQECMGNCVTVFVR